ncbi:MAG: tetratricopeptide repeat protein [Bacteroidetes bacterium]|nr:tetratricopeptide repeat protein [Bacteroidota bacterium]
MSRFTLLFAILPLFAFPQTSNVDSLLNELGKSKSDTIKSRLYFDIAQELAVKYPDSAIYYFQQSREVLFGMDDSRKLMALNAERAIANVYTLYKSNPQKSIEIIDSIIVLIKDLEKSKNSEIARKASVAIGQCYIIYGNCNRLKGLYNDALADYLKALEIAESLGEEGKLLQDSYNNLGVIYRYLGELDKAIEFNMKALESYEKSGNEPFLAGVLNNIGNVYHVQGNYSKALEFYQKALDLFEKNNDAARSGTGYYNIGVLHYYMKNHDIALEYFRKSLEIREKIGDRKGIINLLIVMGMSSDENKQPKVAEEYFLKALEKAIEYKDQSGTAHSYSGLSLVNKNLQNYFKAIEYSNKALEIFENTGNINGVMSTKNAMAELYFLTGNYRKSVVFGKSSFDLAYKSGFINSQLDATKWLIKSYEAIGDFKSALIYANNALILKDSIFSSDMAKATSEMEARFQTERKQLEIENLTKEKALQEAEIALQKGEVAKQRTYTIIFLSGFILVVGLSYLIYRQYKAKKTANELLELQNSEINQKNEEIRTQRDEISSQRDYVVRQKEYIEASHQRITDSINYAKLIQSALLPSEEILNDILQDSMIYYKPRDIVSGDFYWVKSIDDFTVVICADCTGHGVPGAFMSMLGIAFLNEIARREDIAKASDILDILRQEVKSALYQKEKDEKANDGIDMSVLFINKKTQKVQFAGARSPLYIIRKSDELSFNIDSEKVIETKVNGHSLIEIKGDNQSVSLSSVEKQFQNHEFNLTQNDTFYLFSDGFIDQLNAETNRRFNAERFKNLLIEIHEAPLKSQPNLLDEKYKEWSNGNEQIDDILIIGLKV